jgi:hypothetical protein
MAESIFLHWLQASLFHPFGSQYFLTAAGAVPLSGTAWPAPDITGPALEYQQANPGVFAFHRYLHDDTSSQGTKVSALYSLAS